MSARPDDGGLRVLHVLNELLPSGAEQMLRLAAPQFRAAGCDLHILTTGLQPGSFAAPLQAAGYRIHHRPWSRWPAFYVALARDWRGLAFDVVHVHAERGNFGYLLAAHAAGASSVVRTVHNHFAFDGVLRLRRAIERRIAARLGTHWVSIAPGVDDNERDRYGMRPTLIANWYDSTRYATPSAAQVAAARQALQIDARTTVLLVVGNCSPIKNHDLLLHALARCKSQDWLLLHAGREHPDHPERELAQALGIADRVRFLGAVSDMLPMLRASDCFVMPSLREGSSIALLEALGVGMPVLLAQSPGLVDLRRWFDDLVFARPDVDDFAAALACLLDRSRERDAERALRTSAIARRQFGIERGVRAYLELYRTDLRRQRPPTLLRAR